MHKLTCQVCSGVFLREHRTYKFCGRACWYTWQSTHRVKGKNWIQKTCETCAQSFEIRPYQKTRGRFCSVICYKASFSKKVSRVLRRVSVHSGTSLLSRYWNLIKRASLRRISVMRFAEFDQWYTTTPKLCGYCDVPQEVLERIEPVPFHSYLQIDRRDNALGYELDNMILACSKCNVVKNAYLSYDEMRIVGQQFMKPKWQQRASMPANTEVQRGRF